MNKICFALFLIAVITGCNKNDCDLEVSLNVNQNQLTEDIEAIDTYLSNNGIEAQTHSSGLRYVINSEGSGSKASLCDQVAVTYQGRLMSNGNVFDGTNNPVQFPLNRLITGWQIGIPLIKSGGSITLFIPSAYGYGSNGSGSLIPTNANLIFDITLVDVN